MGNTEVKWEKEENKDEKKKLKSFRHFFWSSLDLLGRCKKGSFILFLPYLRSYLISLACGSIVDTEKIMSTPFQVAYDSRRTHKQVMFVICQILWQL